LPLGMLIGWQCILSDVRAEDDGFGNLFDRTPFRFALSLQK